MMKHLLMWTHIRYKQLKVVVMHNRWKLSFLLGVSSMALSACVVFAPKKEVGLPDIAKPEPSRCLSAEEIAQWSHNYANKLALSNPPQLINAEDAQCTRKQFQAQLAINHGDLVGYKVTLTNAEVQKNFDISEPIWGAYYATMLPSRKGKITIDTQYGVHPIYEASLMVRVKSAAINTAQTPDEVLKHIDQIVPFVELADVAVQKPSELTAHGFMAINAGARTGVLGRPLKVSKSTSRRKRMLRQLENMSVRVIGENGKLIGHGSGKDTMGHPLQPVLWLIQKLQTQGQALKPKQWISVGSFSPMLRPKAGQKITIAYPGLTGARSLVLYFE